MPAGSWQHPRLGPWGNHGERSSAEYSLSYYQFSAFSRLTIRLEFVWFYTDQAHSLTPTLLVAGFIRFLKIPAHEG